MHIFSAAAKEVRLFFKKVAEDAVDAYACQAAFFIILSFFPFVMFVLTLIQYIPFPSHALNRFLLSVVPFGARQFVEIVLSEMDNKASGAIVSVTAFAALWSSSKGVLALIRGLGGIYGVAETRNFLRVRIASLGYTFVLVLMLIASLGVLVFGDALYAWIVLHFPGAEAFAVLAVGGQTLLGICLLTLFVLLLFLVEPRHRETSLLEQLPGAVLSAVGWVVFSFLFSYYMEHFSNFSYLYGSLAAMVLLMLWLYFSMYILFLGAELNVWLPLLRERRKDQT